MSDNTKKFLYFSMCAAFSIVIFIFHIWYIRETNVPVIRNDEYGYWSHAALFTGHDWSDVLANHMHWYAYGYSLVLVPLFWVSHNMHIMYRIAIVYNGVFGVLTFLVCMKCARILFPKLPKWMTALASFLVCMYSSYITQGQIAWSETFLYLLIWLLLYAFLLFEKNPTTGRALLVSALMGACYITHNRTIGIVTAYFILVVFLRFTEHVNWKQFAALLFPLIVILAVNVDIKAWICEMEGYGLQDKNGLGNQKEHFLSLLTLQGWYNLIRSLSGQLWALATSTFGLLYWGMARCVGRVWRAFRTRTAGGHTSFYLFTLLAALGTFLVSAISLIDPAAITNLGDNADLTYFIYTRYDECIIGILLLLGFLELAVCRKNRRFVLSCAAGILLYTVLSVILHFNLQRITDTWHYRSFCAAGVGFYRLFSEKFSMNWCIVAAASVCATVTLLCVIHSRAKRKRLRTLSLVAACAVLIAAFIPTGLYSASIGTISSQRGKITCGNLAMYDTLKSVVGSRKVYCTLDDTKNYRIAYELQVNLIDTKVCSVTLEDVPADETGYFICCSCGDLDKFEGDDYFLLTQGNAYAVVIKGRELAAEIAPQVEEKLVNLDVLQ